MSQSSNHRPPPTPADAVFQTAVSAFKILSPEEQQLFAERVGLRQAGWPVAAFGPRVVDDAHWWASFASRAELAAYAWATFTRLSSADQARFLRAVERRRAAA
jgi:hypothetical protein